MQEAVFRTQVDLGVRPHNVRPEGELRQVHNHEADRPLVDGHHAYVPHGLIRSHNIASKQQEDGEEGSVRYLLEADRPYGIKRVHSHNRDQDRNHHLAQPEMCISK